MKASRSVALALAACLASSSAYGGIYTHSPSTAGSPLASWLIIGCASGIILAALMANRNQNRPLSANEAWTCGFAFWFKPR